MPPFSSNRAPATRSLEKQLAQPVETGRVGSQQLNRAGVERNLCDDAPSVGFNPAQRGLALQLGVA